jgi:hypothetical protein
MPLFALMSSAYQDAEEPESPHRIASSGALRVDGRRFGVHRLLFQQLPAFRDVADDALLPGAILFALQQRNQGLQRRPAVPHQAAFHGVAQADHLRVDVDLHPARLALFGQEFRVGKAGANHQQRVALVHHVEARPGADHADRAGHERYVVRHRHLAQQRLGDTGAQQLGHLDQFLRRPVRAGTGEDCDLVAGVQDVGGGLQRAALGHQAIADPADAGKSAAVLARRGLHRVQGLQVVRHDDAGRAALGPGNTESPVDQVPHLLGAGGHVHVFPGDVLEQRHQVDFLLVVRAQRGALLLADDGDHRLVVELGVVQAVEQVDGARSGRRDAHAHFARVFGVGARHQGGEFLVAGLHELDAVRLVFLFAHRVHDAVDGVPGVAEQAFHAPVAHAPHHEFTDFHSNLLRYRWLGSLALTSLSRHTLPTVTEQGADLTGVQLAAAAGTSVAGCSS